MPTPLTLIRSTGGDPLTVKATDGTVLIGGQQAPTTPAWPEGIRDTRTPTPIHYNAAALDLTPTETPTVTVSTLNGMTASAFAGATRKAWNSTLGFTMLGLIPESPLGSYAMQTLSANRAGMYSIDFEHTGTKFAAVMHKIAGTEFVRLWVDGARHPAASKTPPGNDYAVLFEFATSKKRRIRLDFRYGALVGLDHDGAVTPTPRPETAIGVIGDSYVEVGAVEAKDQPGTPSVETWAGLLGPLLGVEVYQIGYGGTGYAAKAPYAHYNSPDRRALHAKARPNYTIVFGSQNDNPTVAEPMGTYARELYRDLATYARTFVVTRSPFSGAALDTLLEPIAKDPLSRVFGYVSPAREGWFAGEVSGQWHWNAHPTAEGHIYYAKKIAAAFAAAHAAAFPEAV